jgi:hypothetical protein
MPWRAGAEGDGEPGSMGNEEETVMGTPYAMKTSPVFPITHQDRISINGNQASVFDIQ